MLLEKISKLFTAAVKHEDNIKKLTAFLLKYGYITDKAENTVDDLYKAIEIFQKIAGLNPTGLVDAKSLGVLDWPRCACKDFLVESATSLNKWGKNNLTYCLSSVDSDMSQEEWIETFRLALDAYIPTVCNLNISRVTKIQDADFVIGFGNEDGSSGTLAWQELPSGSNFNGQLEGQFDKAETWLSYKNRNSRGIWAIAVIRHEILGHGLGLSHTDVKNQIMNPYYSANIDTMQTAWDIPQLQARYGKPVNSPTPVPVPVPTPTPAPVPVPTPNRNDYIVRFTNGQLSVDGYRLTRIG